MTSPRRPDALLAAVALLGSSGCATTWAAIQIAGGKTYSTDGHETSVTAAGDPEQKLGVEVRSVSPLALGCTLEVRRHEHVRETWHRWGTGWKVVGGAAFVVEGLIGAAGLASPIVRSDRDEVAAYGYLALDALATGILLLALSPEATTTESDVARPWSTQASCPDGLSIHAGDGAVTVDRAGRLPDEQGATVARAAFLTGAPVTLQWGTRVEALPLSPEQRCSWAGATGEPTAARTCAPPVPSFSPASYAPRGPYQPMPVVRPASPLPPLYLRIELPVPPNPPPSR
jgi:hypothetical protein